MARPKEDANGSHIKKRDRIPILKYGHAFMVTTLVFSGHSQAFGGNLRKLFEEIQF